MADKPPRAAHVAPRFLKSKKRLPAVVQTAVDEQVTALLVDPLKGEPKKGALSGVRVVKFKALDRQYALAYSFHSKRNVIETLDVGVHENFYRGLEGYLRGR